MRLGHLAILAVVVFGTLGAAEPKPKTKSKAAEPDLPPLNAKVVKYCRENIGKKVANGQCASLAVEALKYAGAKLFPQRDSQGDYVWGREIESFRDALPGDILQFRDTVFKGKRSLPGNRTLTWNESYAHHTAVIVDVKERGKIVTVLHQNTGPDGSSQDEMMIVKEGKLFLDARQPGGKIWIYRPIGLNERNEKSPENDFIP